MICSPILLLLLEEQMEMGRDVSCTTQKPQLTLFTINHYTVSCLIQKLFYDSAVCTLETLWEGSNSVMYVHSY